MLKVDDEAKTWMLWVAAALSTQLIYRIAARHRCCIEPEGGEIITPPSKFQDLQEPEYLQALLQILSRLPVKTLLQLKSVCRRWNQIIDPNTNPLLVSMHLQNYYNNNNKTSATTTPAIIYELVQGYPDEELEATILQLEHGGDAPGWLLQPPTVFSTNVRPDWHQHIPMRIISGPCNGIYLLGYPKKARLEYSLWNPATGSFRELPIPATRNDFYTQSYGFGLDTVADDFKVVLILHYRLSGRYSLCYGGVSRGGGGYSLPECPSRVLVYSLRTDKWTELDELRHDVEIVKFTETYRYLNGFFFWLCVSPVAALAFDMGKDVFRVIKDPDNVTGEADPLFFAKQLVVYKEDSLALFLNQGCKYESSYDMWLLLYEEEDWRWVKTCSIGRFVPRELRMSAVVGSWGADDDGNHLLMVLIDDGRLRDCCIDLFDPATGTTTKRILHDSPCWPYGIFNYRDSLVSVGERSVPVSRSVLT